MNGKSILITGGTGSFGKAFTKFILKKYKKIKRLVIFSRDELKQSEMARTFSKDEYPSIRYFIGDVRDLDRISRALNKIDIVIHAAALKQVPVAEYNPIEFIKTNVVGAQNLIEACLNNKVKKVIALSTDKACAPINLYGATKLCSDKLFIAANNYSGKDCSFSIVRYGNVLGSRGSVLPILSKFKTKGVFGLTSDEMTRFSITLEEGVKVVDWSIKNLSGGDLVVPKIPSYHILDLIKAMKLKNKYKIVGIRKGEKIHEEMVTSADSYNTYDVGSYYIILADSNSSRVSNLKKRFKSCKKVKVNFSYNSKDNPDFLSVKQLIKMTKV
ncbi:MAG: UDP-N-acetylglucosamine 4,6-dehydratase (inverting) [Candidatus Pelagibacter sp.]|nr:UDP-N-acetylglucosamine 4,6-dehydratase (inverting) [Candidatus Pelagibacter sp.]RPG11214.1 MAG: UDP-N-acetylglucosamine 4,6-dehydratase (inverting) [Pelagibacteraceae bacterium TMED170]|tara:strand:- start:42 stop:1025 length:984 start_codon:yes stop_codon:yes gene_type:complete